MKIIYLFLLSFLFCFSSLAQKKVDSTASFLNISGFVNAQSFLDTRKNVEAREAMFILYPENENLDPNGKDINDKMNFNQLAMTSRLAFEIQGPEAFGAKSKALIESDFTGVGNDDNNGLRLRHAYFELNWEKRKLLIGQYWHPLYLPESNPRTISLNTGAPFHAFSRHIQVRLEQKINNFTLIAFAGSQRDYNNIGPAGRSTSYLRNAAIPNFHLQSHFSFNTHLMGLGLDYKSVLPELSSGKGFRSLQTVNTFAAMGFFKLEYPKISIKVQATWGENLTEHIMLGGFAVTALDTLSGNARYTPLSQYSVWTDIISKREKFNIGLFAAFLENLGADDVVLGPVYARGSDIGYIWRFSPRLIYKSNNLMLSSEFEFTVAAYGTPNSRYRVEKTKEIPNFRLLLAAFYFF
jgi:hypothetical protein